MVAEHVDDADGEMLRRVRNAVGPAVPIVASLDFHANLSPQMAHAATALVSYRTYPHVDMAETGARAARVLHDVLRGARVASHLEQADFLIPLTSQSTLSEPLQSLMAEAAAAERSPLLSVCLAPGFPAADVADCGPAVYACGTDAVAVTAPRGGSRPSCSAARRNLRSSCSQSSRRSRTALARPRRAAGRSSSRTPRTIRAQVATPTP